MTPIPPITTGYQFWAFALVVGFQAWQLWMQRQTHAELADVKVKQVEQHLATNSRMDELLKVAREAAHASGMAEGVATERATALKLLAAKPTPIEHQTGPGPEQRLEEIRGQT